MANSVDPDQTAPICSGPTLIASILQLVSNVRQLFAADDFSRRQFSDACFLGALRVKEPALAFFDLVSGCYNGSLFCDVFQGVLSSLGIVWQGNRKLVAMLNFNCVVAFCVFCLILTVH